MSDLVVELISSSLSTSCFRSAGSVRDPIASSPVSERVRLPRANEQEAWSWSSAYHVGPSSVFFLNLVFIYFLMLKCVKAGCQSTAKHL